MKYQASSKLLWLYSLVCVRPGHPEKKAFSGRESLASVVISKVLYPSFFNQSKDGEQELSHDSIARLNCALLITKIRAVA